jgi:hypothetical protein
MRPLRALILAGWVCALAACSTVTIVPGGATNSSKVSSEPTYVASQSFYLFGLIGVRHVNVDEVCNGRPVLQMQTQQTASDTLLGLVTLGIYSPYTAKVWCEKE